MRKYAVLFVIAALLFGGCSRMPTRSPENPESKLAQSFTTIRLLTLGQSATMDAVISAFHAAHPEYRVEYVPAAAAADKRQMVTTMASQNAVDVMPLIDTRGMVGDMLLLDLEPYINRSRFDMAGFGPLIDQMRIGGKLYDLPYALGAPVLVYNREMFQAAGVPLPRAGWTWDDFRTAAKRLTSGSGERKVWGLASDRMLDLTSSWMVSRTGSYPWMADERAAREWLQFFGTLISTDGSVWPAEAQGPGPVELFTEGRAAMIALRLDALPRLPAHMSGKIDVAPLPMVPGGKSAGYALINSMGISAKSANPDAAWVFLSYLTGPEGAAVVAKAGSMPARTGPQIKQAWLDRKPAPLPGTEALFSTTWNIPPRDDASVNAGLIEAANSAVEGVLTGQVQWEQAAAELVRVLKANGR